MSKTDRLSDFKREVEPLSSDGRMHIVQERHSPTHFGDALLVLEGSRMRIRLVADRGQIFADLASAATPPRWMELGAILPHIIQSGRNPGAGPWETVSAAVQHIRDEFTTLEAFLNSQHPALAEIRESP